MYGNPNFGPRVNLRPPNIHTPEFSAGSRKLNIIILYSLQYMNVI